MAGAAPYKRPSSVLTLPIRSLHRVDPDSKLDHLHLQKIFRRAHKRFAQLTGRETVDIRLPVLSGREVDAAKSPDVENSLGLAIDGPDFGYVATFQLGTPPRDFLILMDSGSSDFWVGSEICKGADGGDCGQHQFLGTKSSSTFVNQTESWNITYGTGSVTGTIVKDNVVIAGTPLNGLTFGVANIESNDFTGADFDGLMGLAQSGLSNQKIATPIEALALAGHINEAIVSYKISRTKDNLNDGEITFGGLDEAKFDPSTLTTVENVSPIGFWSAQMDGVSVNKDDLNISNRTAILDTGTSLIFVPEEDAKAIHQNIQGATFKQEGFITVPCNMTDSVALTFGGQTFSIDPRDMAPGGAAGTDQCVSGIQIRDDNNKNEWLVGDVFLKNAYFSTNVNRNSISLAKLR